MDVAALRDRIQCTLDANADTRRQAELDLKYVCNPLSLTSYCEALLLGSWIAPLAELLLT